MNLIAYYEDLGEKWKIVSLEYHINNMPYYLNVPDHKPLSCTPHSKDSLKDKLKDWADGMDSYLLEHRQDVVVTFIETD